MEKKEAILVVSFGSSYEKARKRAIEPIETLIEETFKNYHVARAFTSNIIIRKLRETQGIHIDTPEEAIEKLINKGFQRIIVQPLHLLAGFEYEKIQRALAAKHRPGVELRLGKPLLYDDIDYQRVVDALQTQLPALQEDQGVLLVGHGSDHGANESYQILQKHLQAQNLPIIVGTIEEGLTASINGLKQGNYKSVILMPFMVVAGDHVINDLLGDDPEAWKNQLESQGFSVEAYEKGIGENPAFQRLYVEHVYDALN